MLMHQPEGPRQRLRLFDATTLVVGSMIGSAIFLALPLMARQVPSPAILIGQWVFGVLLIASGVPFYAIWRRRAGTNISR